MAKHVPLADVLSQIADELVQAGENARKRGTPVMQFAECEVEFAVEAETQKDGGVKIWVLTLGGAAKSKQSNRIRVKFTAMPGNPITAAHLGDDPAVRPSLERKQEE